MPICRQIKLKRSFQLVAVQDLDAPSIDLDGTLFFEIGQHTLQRELLDAKAVGNLLATAIEMNDAGVLLFRSLDQQIPHFLPDRHQRENIDLMRQKHVDVGQRADEVHTQPAVSIDSPCKVHLVNAKYRAGLHGLHAHRHEIVGREDEGRCDEMTGPKATYLYLLSAYRRHSTYHRTGQYDVHMPVRHAGKRIDLVFTESYELVADAGEELHDLGLGKAREQLTLLKGFDLFTV